MNSRNLRSKPQVLSPSTAPHSSYSHIIEMGTMIKELLLDEFKGAMLENLKYKATIADGTPTVPDDISHGENNSLRFIPPQKTKSENKKSNSAQSFDSKDEAVIGKTTEAEPKANVNFSSKKSKQTKSKSKKTGREQGTHKSKKTKDKNEKTALENEMAAQEVTPPTPPPTKQPTKLATLLNLESNKICVAESDRCKLKTPCCDGLACNLSSMMCERETGSLAVSPPTTYAPSFAPTRGPLIRPLIGMGSGGSSADFVSSLSLEGETCVEKGARCKLKTPCCADHICDVTTMTCQLLSEVASSLDELKDEAVSSIVSAGSSADASSLDELKDEAVSSIVSVASSADAASHGEFKDEAVSTIVSVASSADTSSVDALTQNAVSTIVSAASSADVSSLDELKDEAVSSIIAAAASVNTP